MRLFWHFALSQLVCFVRAIMMANYLLKFLCKLWATFEIVITLFWWSLSFLDVTYFTFYLNFFLLLFYFFCAQYAICLLCLMFLKVTFSIYWFYNQSTIINHFEGVLIGMIADYREDPDIQYLVDFSQSYVSSFSPPLSFFKIRLEVH